MGTRLSLKSTVLLNIFVFLACVLAVSALPTAVSQAQESNVQAGPSPTPQPSPSLAALEPARVSKLRRVFSFLKCESAKKTKEQELDKTGPQFPRDYDASDFSIVALTKGGWDVAFEYELEPGSTITITLQVKDVAPFSQTAASNVSALLPGTLPDRVSGLLVFRLPERPGEIAPQATLISFRAATNNSSGRIPAYFRLNAFGLGNRALSALLNQPGNTDVTNARYLKASFSGFQPPDDFGSLPGYTNRGVAITAVNLESSQVRIKPGATVNYNFVSTNEFGAWRADYLQDVKKPSGVHSIKIVARDLFNQTVRTGPNPKPPPLPAFSKWKIKQASRGQYSIQVSAWWTVNQRQVGGEAACRNSSSLVNLN